MEDVLVLWGMGMATFGVAWVLRLVSKALDRKHQRAAGGLADPELRDRLLDLERQVEALGGALDHRISEIEERQDFAERLLTQATRDPGRGTPG